MRLRTGEFGIFPRRSRKTVYFYYWVYDKEGNRKYRSTGKQNYNEALKYCRSLQIRGQLFKATSYSFDAYTRDFFIYETCPYISYRLLRGYSYGKSWAKRQRSLLENIIMPYYKDIDIRNITSKMVDEFLLKLRQKNTGAKTLNHVLTAIKAIFGYGKKTGTIEENPAEGIKPFKVRTREKGIFTKEELFSLFATSHKLSEIWKNPIHFLVNSIAATTGLRLGEILALRPEYITETSIKVEHSWNRCEGLKGTKTGKKRVVPISIQLGKILCNYIRENKVTGYVFSVNGKNPIDHKVVYKYFWYALSKIGITKEIRINRNISFHSYRHTFNTFLLEAGVPPETIRLITGHSTNMTARYSHIQLNNMPGVIENIFTLSEHNHILST